MSPLWQRDADHRLHHRAFTVRDNLSHLGAPTAAPCVAPACGPPLSEGVYPGHDPAADPVLRSAPAFEFNLRLSW